MFELSKRVLLTGIGLAATTKDKIEELAKELVEKGEVSEKEGKELVDDLLKKSEQAQQEMEEKVEQLVRDALTRLDLATKDDISELAKKVERLAGARAEEAE